MGTEDGSLNSQEGCSVEADGSRRKWTRDEEAEADETADCGDDRWRVRAAGMAAGFGFSIFYERKGSTRASGKKTEQRKDRLWGAGRRVLVGFEKDFFWIFCLEEIGIERGGEVEGVERPSRIYGPAVVSFPWALRQKIPTSFHCPLALAFIKEKSFYQTRSSTGMLFD
jgi:hypothetical protein